MVVRCNSPCGGYFDLRVDLYAACELVGNFDFDIHIVFVIDDM